METKGASQRGALLLASYLASEAGRHVSPKIERQLVWILGQTKIGALTTTETQVDVLRQMLERVARIDAATGTRPLLKSRRSAQRAGKQPRSKVR